MVENFAMQWLQLLNLKGFAPDSERFPRPSMSRCGRRREETEEYFAYIVREDRSVLEMLSSGCTFLNKRPRGTTALRE